MRNQVSVKSGGFIKKLPQICTFTGHLNEVAPDLVREVKKIAKYPTIKSFYIGRTNNLDQSLYRHRADDILPVYETQSINYSLSAEEFLINIFWDHPKLLNGRKSAGGGVSEDYVQFVYVAVDFYGRFR